MPLTVALSGLQSAASDLRIIGNNIANAGTNGYKKSRAEFSDVYAATELGASSTSIGTGVNLSSVTQMHTQGVVNFSDNNLDLAISGNGFFIISDSGAEKYTRAGTYGVDKDGFISNSTNQKLRGFTATNGEITQTLGDLQIKTNNIEPKITSNAKMKLNLDASAVPPSVPFVRGFTSANPPSPTSYNSSSSVTIYDSLGVSHILTTYYVKAYEENTWRVYTGIDGADVTSANKDFPGTNQLSIDTTNIANNTVTNMQLDDLKINDISVQPNGTFAYGSAIDTKQKLIDAINSISNSTNVSAAVEEGTENVVLTAAKGGNIQLNLTSDGSIALKDGVSIAGDSLTTYPYEKIQRYPETDYAVKEMAAPYTLKFNSIGAYLPTSESSPATYYGPSYTGSVSAMSDPGSLDKLSLNSLFINGTEIEPITNVDLTSPSLDADASAYSLSQAINSKTELHGATAVANDNILRIGTGNADFSGITSINEGDLKINGVDLGALAMSGNGHADRDALITAISNSPNGVTASAEGDQGILLKATNGTNIQIELTADGSTALNAGNVNIGKDQIALVAGQTYNKVQRGSITLNPASDSVVELDVNGVQLGLQSGKVAGIYQPASDPIQITGWQPTTGANIQDLSLNLDSSTQFSAPFTVSTLTQDGYSTGRISGVDVDTTGVITARYGNGQSQVLGQVALASFKDTRGLQPLGDTAFSETFSSGEAILGAPGTSDLGLIQSGALEDSNVILTQELVSLIVAQRNFQANAQTVKTADAVTQTVISLR